MRKKGAILIAMGLLLLAAALLLTVYNIWDGHRADQAAQQTYQALSALIAPGEETTAQTASQTASQPAPQAPTGEPQPTGEPEPTQEPEPTGEPEPTQPSFYAHREMPTLELNGYRYIGTLEVEDMELSLPVMEEWDYDRLRISPCRFAGNVYDDDLVICAHNYPNHFSPLKFAPLGTQVKFTDAQGTEFCYAVTSIDTVGPNDVEAMLHGDWDLTLFTCNTNGQTRCAIRCQRVQ